MRINHALAAASARQQQLAERVRSPSGPTSASQEQKAGEEANPEVSAKACEGEELQYIWPRTRRVFAVAFATAFAIRKATDL
jgi:hypothetical protein